MDDMAMPSSGKYPYPDIVAVDNLCFDPQNPRLPAAIDGGDEQQVLKWMLQDAGLLDLLMSIGQQGYFSGEPLLVVPFSENGSKVGKYIVVEGNRRLAAVKLLNQPDLASVRVKAVQLAVREAKEKPSNLPVIIYEKRADILDYLGYRHVTGIKAWEPLAKARYLSELAGEYSDIDEDERYRLLAKNIGSRSDYVRKLLAGLALYNKIESEDFFDLDLTEDDVKFSLITTALGYRNITDFLGLEDASDLLQTNLKLGHLKELTSWMFKPVGDAQITRLGESRNLRLLNAIVGNGQALEEFRGGAALDEAVLYTNEPIETFRSLINEASSRVASAFNLLVAVQSPNLEDVETVDKLIKRASDIRTLLKSRLASEENEF